MFSQSVCRIIAKYCSLIVWYSLIDARMPSALSLILPRVELAVCDIAWHGRPSSSETNLANSSIHEYMMLNDAL